MNLFEQATRQALRFPSARGPLTTEQLWELPLQAKNGFDLDNTAKAINAELRDEKEESFVDTGTSPARATLELKLEILKHIIAVKKAENTAARDQAARRAEKQRLLEIMQGKKDEALTNLSIEEIQARIDALG